MEQHASIHPGDIGPHTTISGRALDPVYGPADVAEIDYAEHLADPGQYPFTRGVHPEMYRTRLWTMRQFAGFGSARDTNERFKFLLSRGQTGLSTAFDLPTLMGRDCDERRPMTSARTAGDFIRWAGDGGVERSSAVGNQVYRVTACSGR